MRLTLDSVARCAATAEALEHAVLDQFGEVVGGLRAADARELFVTRARESGRPLRLQDAQNPLLGRFELEMVGRALLRHRALPIGDR